MINIGVTGTGSLVGQAIIKCIKDSVYYKNAVIFGFDYIPETVGSYWVDHNFILPDITSKEVTYLQAIEALIPYIKDNNIDILFIGIDFDLPMYAKYKSLIEAQTNCKVIVSNEALIEIADDKYKTYRFLKENNFAYPETFLINEVPKDFTFPAILKPCTGASSIGVSIVNDIFEATAKAQNLQNPILQELIGDAESEYTCGVVYLEGELIDLIVLKRKLKKGETFKAIHKNDFPESIYDYLKQLAFALKPNGVCNFQIRLDKNQVPKLFEINGRHSGTTYFRCLFGYNELEIILNHYFPVADYKKPVLKQGMAMRFFDEKLIETY